MPRKSRNAPSKNTKRRRSLIDEPFQMVSLATIDRGTAKLKVPMLILYGEWLKAIGFPIGSAAYLTTDRHGELALNRIRLAMPRRLYVRAARG